MYSLRLYTFLEGGGCVPVLQVYFCFYSSGSLPLKRDGLFFAFCLYFLAASFRVSLGHFQR